MPRKRLTDRFVESVKVAEGERTEWWDEKETGLALRVSNSAKNGLVKTWAVTYRVRKFGAAKQVRYTLGRYAKQSEAFGSAFDALDLAKARAMAKNIMVRVANGEDPANEKKHAGVSRPYHTPKIHIHSRPRLQPLQCTKTFNFTATFQSISC